MKRLLVSLLALLAAASLVVAGCSSAAPAASPTKAAEPAKAAEPTKAPAAAQPTAAAAQPAAAPAAQKVNFPEKGKTITIIVPVSAGGGSDVSTRVLIPSLQKALNGANVEVVNKAGANQQLGHTEFVKAKPDGYTIAMTNLPTTFTNYLDPERKAVYNRQSFVPIATPVLDPGIIVVKADTPYKDLKELVEAAKKKPGEITIGATGLMTAPHLMLLQLEQATGAKFNIVQFDKGAADATNALLGGHIQGQSGYIGDLFTQVKSGTVRALAVADTERSPFLPNIPVMKELGIDLTSYIPRGYSVQKDTPQEIVNVLEAAFKAASNDPDVKAKQTEMGLTQKFLGSKEYGALWDKMEKDAKPLVDAIKAQNK